ncbi:GNAT family N-acetyltransferase [Nesterenkonia ebinurensis]|uniref:GNAT family N-acetyltransferase n=1 Tax=Nesterenkonia ebinurensis TaxID=2608252 RepID=UPI00123E3ABC|nr:GNAT family N-acetyltransferase [Nesterenkonia ebinurensis]
MTSCRIIPIDIPTRAEDPVPAWLVAWQHLESEHHLEVLGHKDMVSEAERIWPATVDQTDTRKYVLAAVPADTTENVPAEPSEYLGMARIGLPISDNQHLAETDVLVAGEQRGQGIGSALWRAVEEIVREAGRSTVISYSMHLAADNDAETLSPAGGSGAIGADDVTGFLTARGFLLEQVEQHSTLLLPADVSRTAAWVAEAEQKAGVDYRLIQWTNWTPDEHLETMAGLRRRMSVDVPTGELDIQEEHWDANRVRRFDQRLRDSQHDYALTAVEHIPSGELVAFTEIRASQGRAGAYQDATLVHGEHRGKRLGLWVKAANLDLLARELPYVDRIHTWNADENAHMLDINRRIGFQLASLEGAWQLRILQ